MITIENVTHKKELNTYVVKVKDKVICTFTHDRRRGLAVCLKEAAAAVIEKEREEK